ncbi:MAG: ArsR family transcriptional regulator [Actinobacteria bacterium]|nr:ArsR family transcriptional regulator [Actinomycetota bacterium]
MADREDLDPGVESARAAALSSPVRWRILRLCLHQPRTNKELAEILDLNPGTTLHHVRLLVDTGFLAPEEPRKGMRNAREIPYRATRLSWHGSPRSVAPVLVRTLLDEIAPVEPEDIVVWRLGMRLLPEDRAELEARITEILEDYVHRDSEDPAAEPWSLMGFLHPDVSQLPRDSSPQPGHGPDLEEGPVSH